VVEPQDTTFLRSLYKVTTCLTSTTVHCDSFIHFVPVKYRSKNLEEKKEN